MEKSTKVLIAAFLAWCALASFIVFQIESVTITIDRSCAEYDMIYLYRDGGQYCMEEDGTLHPIYSKCPGMWQRKNSVCELTFIKQQGADIE